MQDYPYFGRDLFEQPESYEYAQCQEPNFFVAWTRSRSRSVAALEQRAEMTDTPLADVVGNCNAPFVPLATILRRLIHAANGEGIVSVQVKSEIDALVMKFEIFRRLFADYGPGLNRASGSKQASFADYILFAEALASFAERLDSTKYLSTLLKVMDCICSLDPSRLRPETAREAARLLHRERTLVARWQAVAP